MIPFWKETILPSLDLWKAGKIEIKGRMDIVSIMNEYPSGVPVCHQWNNEYNYMVMEFFWSGYPVLHNASDWKEFGYVYTDSDIYEGSEKLEEIRKIHTSNKELYKSHARALAWRHSPYNPDVQRAWRSMLESAAKDMS